MSLALLSGLVGDEWYEVQFVEVSQLFHTRSHLQHPGSDDVRWVRFLRRKSVPRRSFPGCRPIRTYGPGTCPEV